MTNPPPPPAPNPSEQVRQRELRFLSVARDDLWERYRGTGDPVLAELAIRCSEDMVTLGVYNAPAPAPVDTADQQSQRYTYIANQPADSRPYWGPGETPITNLAPGPGAPADGGRHREGGS